MHAMRTIETDVPIAWSVCQSLCQSVCSSPTPWIQVLFRVKTVIGPRNIVLDWALDTPTARGKMGLSFANCATQERVTWSWSCHGLKCSSNGGGFPNCFTLRLCNKIMMAVRETRVKREICCHIFYIVYRKLLTLSNYYKVYNVFITWHD